MSARWAPWLVVAIVVVGVLLRLVPVSQVVTSDGVYFLGADAWAHMRLVDGMMLMGRPLWYDSFAVYPDGAAVGYTPGLTVMVVGLSKIVGLGSPTQFQTDVVGAALPVVLGAFVIVLVYFLARQQFRQRWLALLACLLAAVMPTEFMNRTLFGFTDHHALEVLATVAVIYFLGERLVWSGLLAGGMLVVLLVGWAGASFFLGVLTFWLLLEYIRREGQELTLFLRKYLLCVIPVVLVVPLVLKDWVRIGELSFVLAVFAAVPVVLYSLRRVLPGRKGRVGVVVVGLAIAAVAVTVVQYEGQSLASKVLLELKHIFWGWGTTIEESQPTTIGVYLTNYGLVGVLFIVGLAVAIWRQRGTRLFSLWSLVMFVAMLGQRRWGYYVAIPMAVYGSYATFWLVHMVRRGIVPSRRRRVTRGLLVFMVVCTLVVAGLYVPGAVRRGPNVGPEMRAAMAYLRYGTEGGEVFDAKYATNGADSAPYGVLTWWDYGNWIIRLGHRMPYSSPAHQFNSIQDWFVAQSEEEADAILEGKRVGYILISRDMTDGIFPALARGMPPTGLWPKEVDWYRVREGSMVYRLYNSAGFGRYKLVFLGPTIKIFKVLEESG